MSRRGRPPDPEDERWQRAQTARRTVDEELAAMQREAPKPSPGKANTALPVAWGSRPRH